MPLTMLLPVELTDHEKVNVLGELSLKLTALEAVKAEKKAATADFNEQIKNLEGSIHGLNESIKSSTVDRPVEIEREPNPFSGKVKIWRLDRTPKEFVKEVDMDPDESQLRLADATINGGAGGKVTKMSDHQRTEEQDAAATPEEAEALYGQRLAVEREERIATLATELTEKVTAVQLPTAEGEPLQFVASLTTGEPPAMYEQTRPTADEARAACAREAAEHITALAEDAAAAARAAEPPPAPDPIDAAIESLRARVVLDEKPGGMLCARIDGAIEGLPGRQGFSGPIRATAQETIDETLAQLRQLLEDNRPWMDAIEASKQNEIAALTADQQADDTATKKRLLKVPAGARSKKKLKVTDEKGNPLPTEEPAPAASADPEIDTTPPPEAAF